MDFTLTSDELLIRGTVRQFMETEMRPVLRDYERAGKFPLDEIRRLDIRTIFSTARSATIISFCVPRF